MSITLDTVGLKQVFGTRTDILEGINRCADSPGRVALFNEIATHVIGRLQENGEPAQKRRKVESGGANGAGPAAPVGNAADEPVLLEVKEISVAVPQRKKFELCFTQNHIYARAPGTTEPIPAITYPWRDIEYAFYLPVPEKTQVQHNYVLFPKGTNLPSNNKSDPPPSIEPLVFTVPATAPKQGTIGGKEAGAAAAVSDTYKGLFHWAIHARLDAIGSSVRILSANPNKFHSMIRQAQRPNEKAVHVSGYRGSKDGYLFFLENGILWGFKKPLIFIPLKRVFAISYTNILQMTFNISVEVFKGDGDDTEEYEFGMLDQQDYGGIDMYIKDNRLQDHSMAEQRKAKLQLAENRAKKGEEDGDATGGQTELEKANTELEQEMQDDEDEDEEDYDPGSEGDSEGSGESSDDDSDDDEDDPDPDDEDDEEGEGEDEEGGEEEEEPVKQEDVPMRGGWAAVGKS